MPPVFARLAALVVIAVGLFAAWWTYHVLSSFNFVAAVFILILSYIGFVIALALLAASARAIALVGGAAFLSGRGIYRWAKGRQDRSS